MRLERKEIASLHCDLGIPVGRCPYNRLGGRAARRRPEPPRAQYVSDWSADIAVGTMKFTGQCHCGALAVEYESEVPPEQTQVRACQCGFCRAHGALSATDPAGMLTFRARDPSAVVRYRFGLKLADFMLCARCGTYLGALMKDGESSLGVLNICALDARDRFSPPVAMRYDGETPEMRLKRRRERWTPARLVT